MNKKQLRSGKGVSVAEFAVVLSVLFMILFAMINLLVLATSCASSYLLAHQTASQAACGANFTTALAACETEAKNFYSSEFAKFSRMTPLGGYNGCGVQLFTISTSNSGSMTMVYGPDAGACVPPPVDTTANVYEFKTVVHAQIAPIYDFSAIPFLSNVPYLSKPIKLNITACRAVEHPEGLSGLTSAVASATFNSPSNTFVLNPTNIPQGLNGINTGGAPNPPITFYTAVPMTINGVSGLYAMSITRTLPAVNPNGNVAWNLSGTFLAPSNALGITTANGFVAANPQGLEYGSAIGLQTNPQANIVEHQWMTANIYEQMYGVANQGWSQRLFNPPWGGTSRLSSGYTPSAPNTYMYTPEQQAALDASWLQCPSQQLIVCKESLIVCG